MFIHAAHGVPREGRRNKMKLKNDKKPLEEGERTNYALDAVERLNYGVSFSPIDGVYVPTEATYNLMMVMNVPMFKATSQQWQKCLPGAYSGCALTDMCRLITPADVLPINRTAEQNQTCVLVDRFIAHLQNTRGSVATNLLDRLKAYIQLSTATAKMDNGVRSKRDTETYYHNIANVDDGGGNKPASTRDYPDLLRVTSQQPSSFIPCHNLTELADHLTCLSYALHSQSMPRDDNERKFRQARAASEPDFDIVQRETQMLMESLAMSLSMAGETADRVNDLMTEMEAPHFVEEPSSGRNRRGLFDFGGKILKSLFGVVTNEEAEDMQYAINALSENQFNIQSRLQTFEKRVVAVANLTNQHLLKMGRVMRQVDNKFSRLFLELHKGMHTTTRFAGFMSSMMLTLVQEIARVEREIEQFLDGLRSLHRGELSIDLVSETFLRDTLGILQEHISSKYPSFSIAEREPVYYYKYGKPSFSWNNGTLIVHLAVPLRSTATAFKLYQVTSYSVPADHNDTLTTRPLLENDIFGISHDGVNFLEMSSDDFQSCTLSKTIRCEVASVIQDVFHKSCLLALYQNDKQAIQELCRYRLEVAKTVMGLKSLSPGRVLVSNAATVSIQCPGRPAVVRSGCTECIWSQPCGCALSVTDGSSKALSMTPVIQGCRQEAWAQKVEYPVNIPALSRLLEPGKLKNISHETYASSLANIPNVHVSVHPLAEDMSMHESYAFGMDLEQAVDQLQKDSVLTPFNLKELTNEESSDSWMKYLPASLGLSMAFTITVYLMYAGHKKGWCRFKDIKAPENEKDPDKGSQSNLKPNNCPSDPRDPTAPPADLRSTVAEILHEYATELTNTGNIPMNLANVQSPMMGRNYLYPILERNEPNPEM